jgi:hypothetical protein
MESIEIHEIDSCRLTESLRQDREEGGVEKDAESSNLGSPGCSLGSAVPRSARVVKIFFDLFAALYE